MWEAKWMEQRHACLRQGEREGERERKKERKQNKQTASICT
jgi:hypothetical protein